MAMTNMVAYCVFAVGGTVVVCFALWAIVQMSKFEYFKEKNNVRPEKEG